MFPAISLIAVLSAGFLGAYVVATLPVAYRTRFVLFCATVASLPLPALPGLRLTHRSFLLVGLVSCGLIANSLRRSKLSWNRIDAAVGILALAYVMMAFVGLLGRAESRWFLDDVIAPYVFFGTYWVARNTRQLTMSVARPWAAGVLVLAALIIISARVGAIDLLTARAEADNAAGRFLTSMSPLAFAAGTWLLFSSIDRRVPRLPQATVLWVAIPTLTILVLDQSRRYLMGLLAMVLATVFTSLVRNLDVGKVFATILLVACPLVAFGAMAAGGLLPRTIATPIERYVDRAMSNTEDTSYSSEWRQFEAEEAIDSFADHTMFGVGLGMPYREALKREPFSNDATGGDAKWVRFVHSSPYWYLVKGGVLGVGAYLAALTAIVFGARRLGPTGTFLTLFLIGWWAISTTVALIDRTTGPTIAVILALLAVEVSNRERRPAPIRRTNNVRAERVHQHVD